MLGSPIDRTGRSHGKAHDGPLPTIPGKGVFLLEIRKKFLQDVPAAVISLVAMSGSLCPDDGAAGGFLARICSVMALHAATMNADDVAVCLMITQSEVPHMTLVSLLL